MVKKRVGKRLGRLFWFLPVALLVGGGIWLYGWVTGPASMSLANPPATNAVLGDTAGLQPWQSAYFTTEIPNSLQVKTSTENTAQQTAGYLLTSTVRGQDDQVGITLAPLGNHSLAEMPAVRVRLNDPQTYSPTARSFAPSGAYVFSRTDSYETDVFWQHGTEYVGVVVSGSGARETELEQTLAAIIGQWQWR